MIAHRGASYDAPEETKAVYQLAIDLGADYLEIDLQRTKDGKLIVFHDKTLNRVTNVEDVFPSRADNEVTTFTLDELHQLDAGSWFNKKYPARARPGFVGLKIVTLEEVIDLIEASENKPGLYIETKSPDVLPGLERDIRDLLQKRNWLHPQTPPQGFDFEKNVGVAYTQGHVVLQTFEKDSLLLIRKLMPHLNSVLLLWLGDGLHGKKDGSIAKA
ncbi:MAG: glycerophosphodiester phosphodiesterase family protein [Candidatus Tectomicrobia bacterium]|nr:glycerophosphodiester phosphodiesterase family protein [Candidatus Tectomicrobia bacterium]